MSLTTEEQVELDVLRNQFKRPPRKESSGNQMQMPSERNGQPMRQNGMMNPEKSQDQGFLADIAYSPPVQGILGFGDALSNMMSSSASTVSKIPNKLGLTEKKGIGYNPIKSGSGLSYSAGEVLGNAAPFVATGGLSLPARVGTSALAGYLFNPEDSAKGAAEGLGWGLATEALGGIVPGAKYIKSKFTTEDLIQNLKKPLQQAYETAKKEAWAPVAGLFEEAKDFKLSPSWKKDVESIVKSNETALKVGGLDTLLGEFSKNANLNTMQDMISQIGTEIRSLNPKDANNRLAISKLKELKQSLTSNVEEMLSAFDPKGPELYRQAMENYAIGPGPFKESKSVREILGGVTEGQTPKKVISDLKKQGQREFKPGEQRLHPDHYLRETLAKAEGNVNRSEALQNASKLLAGAGGAAAGYSMFGPAGLLGGLAGNYLTGAAKSAGNLMTNETVGKLLSNPKVRAAIMGNQVATSNEPISIDLMGEY